MYISKSKYVKDRVYKSVIIVDEIGVRLLYGKRVPYKWINGDMMDDSHNFGILFEEV